MQGRRAVHAKLEEMCNLVRAVVLKVKFTCHATLFFYTWGRKGEIFTIAGEKKIPKLC